MSAVLSHRPESRLAFIYKRVDPVELLAKEALSVASYSQIRRNVRCCTSNCDLTLTGQVDSFYLKQTAQELVRAVCGSKMIRNQIEVV